ncbi:putative DNA-binding protein [Clostridium sp. UBA6640]|uniref:putative DNA-binding protein n=1 Tax=Clostridium sp. UBA6640 TaxID=1946370 RepID=UPI0025BC925C|nr:putative DNA-binding protein [Clostridium sp. UBA6640]
MEKRLELSLLLDFYGPLLTEKQRDIMGLYFNDDLSLKEISEITNTSRQAIHDLIKRCNSLLLEYEKKLHLLEKSLEIKNSKERIIKKIGSLDIEDHEKSEVINDIIKNIIEI